MEIDISGKDPGRQLRIVRTLRALKQSAMAGRLGVDTSLVSMIETGRRKPGPALAKRIERLYGIPSASWSGKRAAA